MCGIAGFIDLRASLTEGDSNRLLEKMICTLDHRGPDDRGWWSSPPGVGLAQARLSILDLSPLGRQPMHSSSGRTSIVFNGEIYNFRALRAELERSGIHFRGHSDTEVLVEALEVWGPEKSLGHLNGMFAFAAWDREEQTLTLARDRIGKKPLYLQTGGTTLLFGSELKALIANPEFKRGIDRESLTLYFRYGFIPGSRSVYSSVRKLLPGEWLTVSARPGEPLDYKFKKYWDPIAAAQIGALDRFTGSDSEAEDRLHSLLLDATKIRLESDVPLGMLLSGGIDSSLVTALIQAQVSTPVKTYSIGFREARYNEAEHAKAIAAHLKTDHTELYLDPRDSLEIISLMPKHFDEPFADSSQLPTYLVSKLARQHVTVALAGDGGDELFAGYNRYELACRAWRRINRLPASARQAGAAALEKISPQLLDRMIPKKLEKVVTADRIHKFAGMLRERSLPEVYRSLLSIWSSPSDLVLHAEEPASAYTPGTVPEIFSDYFEQMMLLDLICYLPDDILAKVDRASMATSLEMRAPLLDYRVVELSLSMPLKFKLRDGMRKWLMRKVLDRYVPRELIDRPKQGFSVPIGDWLRGELKGWAEELIEPGRLRREGYLNPELVRSTWNEHQSGRRNRAHHLWSVLMFQLWLERYEA
jgi:asparagine synthase (glutamine-hydrolysing)